MPQFPPELLEIFDNIVIVPMELMEKVKDILKEHEYGVDYESGSYCLSCNSEENYISGKLVITHAPDCAWLHVYTRICKIVDKKDKK